MGSAIIAKVASFRWERPMPPPTTTLNPSSSPVASSHITTSPRSLVKRSMWLSPGTVMPILNFLGRNCGP